MLTLTEIRDVIDRHEYMPGWKIEAYETPFQGVCVAISASVDDSYNPGQQVDLRIESLLPPIGTEDQLIEWLHWRLRQIACHEVDEWFRRKSDHRPVFDPHGPDALKPAGVRS